MPMHIGIPHARGGEIALSAMSGQAADGQRREMQIAKFDEVLKQIQHDFLV
ncbi:hypothetical protein [Mucilaginibacter segetis]|uniref:Uncharacterized protein n=1 Tax=Mucilaginibacter segetis TaxID=2793071 RepID=A0A934PNZ4_9SPHI|nr:hypothetical protein [Mucilaginibacter segetis]MBK0378064.1 hypothetical protein [Mucilaginibacter segetis]